MAIDRALHAFAEPRRREILELVRGRELSSGDIASHFPISGAAISQHLRVLREAGLVAERREGTRRLYRARPQAIADLRTYLERFWDDELGSLKRAAERAERRRYDV